VGLVTLTLPGPMWQDLDGALTAQLSPTPAATPPAPRQQSLDDLGTPLAEVTFVVLDLETTGASPSDCAITEVGALKLRGGELLGTFETLVNPGVPIPPTITVLTGITEAMVLPAPRIAEVLPSLLEFIGDAVVVGHNVRFDIAFLDAAAGALDHPQLPNRRVDTLGLARRLLRDEVPNLRLSTLARHLRTAAQPVHRAYADAAATAEILHTMLERAAGLGVLGLDDLLALPSIRSHPSASKLRLTTRLPRKPGIYVFRDRGGRVLYVGKASNLRARVRSYFSGDDRRKVPQLLRETEAIDHLVCASPFEAAVRELRMIQALAPRFNRQAKGWRRYAYVKLTSERFPRLMVTRTVRDDGGAYLGPLPSARVAHIVREAIESAVPIRRCNRRVGARTQITCDAPCVPAQLGVATCPCRGQIDDDGYAQLAGIVRRALVDGDHDALFEPLRARMERLAGEERYEEAALTRDRLGALARALSRRRLVERWRGVPRLVVDTGNGTLELRHGRAMLGDTPTSVPLTETAPGTVCSAEEVDELVLAGRWLDRSASQLRIVEADGVLASVIPALPSYEARAGGRSDGDAGVAVVASPSPDGAGDVGAAAGTGRPPPPEPSGSRVR
jgi:DNA polymerase-3 subunit epsilon